MDVAIVGPSAEMTHLVLPQHGNPLGNVLGGRVMHLIDLACSVAAVRLCRMPVATVAVDRMFFKYPIKVGALIIIQAHVNRAFNTSMEVGAKVFSEDMQTGKREHSHSAYLTFVALNPNGRPAQVPSWKPVTDEQKRWHENAEIRRKNRLEEHKRLKGGN